MEHLKPTSMPFFPHWPTRPGGRSCRALRRARLPSANSQPPFSISQPAVSRHLKVLERAGLIEREIDEQRRPARLKGESLAAAVDWLADFKAFWGGSFDQLDDVLAQLKRSEAEETNHE